MSEVPGYHYTMYFIDRLHNEAIGLQRDYGGAFLRDLHELTGEPFEVIFEDLN